MAKTKNVRRSQRLLKKLKVPAVQTKAVKAETKKATKGKKAAAAENGSAKAEEPMVNTTPNE